MVALMKITRDICRLLGFASGPPAQQQEEHKDRGATVPGPNDARAISQDALNVEEDLSDDEKVRRRAERRRAKRKRRRIRKKSEQLKQTDKERQDEDEKGGESELEDSDSEAEANVEGQKDLQKDDKKDVKAAASDKPTTSKAATPSKERRKAKSTEEEPEWDISSAFFANAASHVKPKGRKSKENKENEARRKTQLTEAMTRKSTSLAEKGIKLVQEEHYSQAARMFTEAIKCDPADYRFYGNRSYCYYWLELYPQALADGERSIQLAPGWPKGYFRKGSALMGMQRYREAEKAMEQVLELDKDCEEAVNELYDCKVLQLMEYGFDEVDSGLLLEKFSTVQDVLATYFDVAGAPNQDQSVVQHGPCPSLWVGNVTAELTEKHLKDVFKVYGEIESIRLLHERFCAFVNFKNASDAARAKDKLNGHFIENTRVVVRYPDRRQQRVPPIPLGVTQQAAASAGPRRRGPVNGDECYFWRTTGCYFGDRCRYKHIPDHKGNDKKPWLP
ncbi:tetratricopeptide repeat protein 31 [Syngnathus acus]|uniref:tetratricopeptide repeat protein 31 n=1 Tax=Syngnathus acus TaxID=161584 RepID=UPI001885EEBA|nr:tetratricopeptide repeat protein 31 [Syngnathus acus]